MKESNASLRACADLAVSKLPLRQPTRRELSLASDPECKPGTRAGFTGRSQFLTLFSSAAQAGSAGEIQRQENYINTEIYNLCEREQKDRGEADGAWVSERAGRAM